jgi:predicted RNA-binding protein YlxR (DUF448 family)
VGHAPPDCAIGGAIEGPIDDAAETAASPRRRCIATGEIHDRGRLLRFVVGPDGTVVPDIEERLPGRGLWLLPRRDIVELAVARRAFARVARRAVSVPSDLAVRLEELLARRCVDSLGLARRAGLAVAGFDRVCEAVRDGRAGLLLCARDGASGGRRKLAGLARDLPCAETMTASELGAAFGRDRIVHAAVGGGKLSRRLLADLDKLAGLRAAAPGAAAVSDARTASPTITGRQPRRERRTGTEAHD